MTWILDQSGTTPALTTGTETQFGANATTNASYVLKVNLANMALGDAVLLRIYTQDIPSGALTLTWSGSFSNIQTCPLVLSLPTPSDISLRATITQTAGTGRTFNWEILRV